MTSGSFGNSRTERRETLALIFQEVLTTIVRIRASGLTNSGESARAKPAGPKRLTVTDVRAFRANLREAIRSAVGDAKRHGYSDPNIELVLLAVVGFLDESILNSADPVFGDWHRETLSNELFGHQLAGQIFFDNLNRLLGAQESPDLANVLEVYRLCLLLGFIGRLNASDRTEIKSLADSAAEKINRIRGVAPTLFPREPASAAMKLERRRDRWSRRLLIVALICIFAAAALFAGFRLSLASGMSAVRALAAGQ